MAPKEPVSREALFNLVWSEPMTNVAVHFGVSSSYLARICQRMGVPRPPRGYWAKKAAGHAVLRPALPAARAHDELVWGTDADRWAGPTTPAIPPTNAKAAKRPEKTNQPSTHLHRLIRGARELFLAGKPNDIGYLRPSKRLLVDLVVSNATLDIALSVANELFLTFEDLGHRVDLAPPSAFARESVDEREKPNDEKRYMVQHWAPCRPTIASWGSVAIGLTIFEPSHKVEMVYRNGKYVPLSSPPTKANRNIGSTWTTMRDVPKGSLMLKAYSPYFRTSWHQFWQLPTTPNETEALRKIARSVLRAARAIPPLAQEAEKIREKEREERLAWQQRWQREMHESQCREALKESKSDLEQIIAVWSEAKKIEAFFDAIEQAIHSAEPELQESLRERLHKARDLQPPPDALSMLMHWQSPEEHNSEYEPVKPKKEP